MSPEPPYDVVEEVSLGRASIDKRFEGDLDATAAVQMLYARTAVPNSAGYVAIERVTGTLSGRTGAFVLQHSGIVTQGEQSLTVCIVPDSGTGALRGISGSMEIKIEGGVHYYTLDFELPG